MNKTAAVLGASANRAKYGNKAVRAFLDVGYTVYPVNPHEEKIEGMNVFRSLTEVPKPVSFVSVYLPPLVGEKLISDIIASETKEVYLNPGAESQTLVEALEAAGVTVQQRCSIRAHGKDPNDYSA